MARLSIQPDWDHIFRDEQTTELETVWVQFKNSEKPSVNGKVLLNSATNQNLSAYDEKQRGINTDFVIENISKQNNSIHISYREQNNAITTFIAPVDKYAFHFDKKGVRQPVYNIDVTENGLGVSSSADGSLLVWTLNEGTIRRKLEGHISDVYLAKFFPSGLVVLSGGADLRIKIWSAENGTSPVMLGHSSGVTDVSIVDKGRNIVSTSRDGACYLWDVGESKCLAKFGNFGCVVNACDISALDGADDMSLVPQTETVISEREIGTENKLVSFACEDGYLRVVALKSRTTIFEYKCESAVNCCSFMTTTTVICGTQNGHIYIFDIQNNNNNVPLRSWKEFRSSILSIAKFKSEMNKVIITTADGSCFIRDLNENSSVIELTGPDCDHVYKAVCNQTHLYTCCRDGFIRKYELNHILNSQ